MPADHRPRSKGNRHIPDNRPLPNENRDRRAIDQATHQILLGVGDLRVALTRQGQCRHEKDANPSAKITTIDGE